MKQVIALDPGQVDLVLEMYEQAREIQRRHEIVIWPDFPREMIESDMAEGRLWALTENDAIACIWTICFNDPLIWGSRDNDPSIYIHRIATHPDFRGRMLVKDLLEWAENYGRQQERKFIRLDTVGNNRKLISHYRACGFDFLGMFTLSDTNGLPDHYRQDAVCLFEKAIPS